MKIPDIRKPEKFAALPLLLILCLALSLRIIMFSGFIGSDDYAYAKIANQVVNGTFEIGAVEGKAQHYLRFGVFLPVAAAFKLFGINEWSLALFPMICSILSIILIYIACKTIFNSHTGLIAAFILAIVPEHVQLASICYPSMASSLWCNIPVVLTFVALNSNGKKQISAGILTGLALGISWYTKATVVFILPFVIGCAIWDTFRKKNINLLVAILIPFSLVLASEFFLYHIKVGDALYRFHVTEQNYAEGNVCLFVKNSPYGWQEGHYFEALFRRLFLDGPRIIFTRRFYGNTTGIALIGLFYAILKRQKCFVFACSWFLWNVFIFNFGTTSLDIYRPLVLYKDQMLPVGFSATVVCAGLLGLLIRPAKKAIGEEAKEHRFWGLLLLLGIILSCAAELKEIAATRPDIKSNLQYLKVIPEGSRIYADTLDSRFYTFYTSFAGLYTIIDYEKTRDVYPENGSYVVIPIKFTSISNDHFRHKIPAYCHKIPGGWESIGENNNMRLYRVPIQQ